MYQYVPRCTPIQNYRSPPQTLVVNLAANLLPPFQIVFPSSIKGQASIINEQSPLLLAFFLQSSIDYRFLNRRSERSDVPGKLPLTLPLAWFHNIELKTVSKKFRIKDSRLWSPFSRFQYLCNRSQLNIMSFSSKENRKYFSCDRCHVCLNQSQYISRDAMQNKRAKEHAQISFSTDALTLR